MTVFLLWCAGIAIGCVLGGLCRNAKLADTHMQGWKSGWLARSAYERSTAQMIAEAELRNAGFTRECDP